MKEKVYKLKEEVKKYLQLEHLNNYWNVTKSLDWWETNTCMTIEALEEVEEKIEVKFSKYGNINADNTIYLHKGDYSEWTEQEREDIEKFLNVFGSWENMINIIEDYGYDVWCEGKNDELNTSFETYIKEKSYDK